MGPIAIVFGILLGILGGGMYVYIHPRPAHGARRREKPDDRVQSELRPDALVGVEQQSPGSMLSASPVPCLTSTERQARPPKR